MRKTKHESSNFSRWWEFYAVRYAVGTVVGAIIVFLLCSNIPELKPILFETTGGKLYEATGVKSYEATGVKLHEETGVKLHETTGGKLDSSSLLLLAGLGLAYCYIASAPILVFHAGRFLLTTDKNKYRLLRRSLCRAFCLALCAGCRPEKSFATYLRRALRAVRKPQNTTAIWLHRVFRLALIFMAPSLLTLAFYCYLAPTDEATRYLYTLVFLIYSLLIWPQFLTIGGALFKTKELLSFYTALDYKRQKHRGALVESYKHLREHGNSFAIVVLEIILAIPIYLAAIFTKNSSPGSTMSTIIMILLVWITPAAFVWLVGTQFERAFSETPDN